jgi:L-rhamnose mutarotase
MAIFALTLNLKNDEGLIREYVEHHRQVWPEVLEALKKTGVQDIKIYISGLKLFMVMVAPANFDPARSFAEYTKDPVAERWDTLMKNFQEKAPEAGPGEWWTQLLPVFDFAAAIRDSGKKNDGSDRGG